MDVASESFNQRPLQAGEDVLHITRHRSFGQAVWRSHDHMDEVLGYVCINIGRKVAPEHAEDNPL